MWGSYWGSSFWSSSYWGRGDGAATTSTVIGGRAQRWPWLSSPASGLETPRPRPPVIVPPPVVQVPLVGWLLRPAPTGSGALDMTTPAQLRRRRVQVKVEDLALVHFNLSADAVLFIEEALRIFDDEFGEDS